MKCRRIDPTLGMPRASSSLLGYVAVSLSLEMLSLQEYVYASPKEKIQIYQHGMVMTETVTVALHHPCLPSMFVVEVLRLPVHFWVKTKQING